MNTFFAYHKLFNRRTNTVLFNNLLVIEDKSDEKEALKDPERGNESNLISLTQLPGHPHEDNNVYLSG